MRGDGDEDTDETRDDLVTVSGVNDISLLICRNTSRS